ncbi:short-chain dehydrogenase [Hydrogenophaga crassostreae]|uniref:Short-chain dehydrogenase n=1 Tax=Hydrogenophaga crassostreae TaxID=1763535 RepID=A0A167ISX7_9BURK|nr:NnrS family protein [Hydrogenophaga crassostreae]AOW14429.1 short-chain dehydrogenase [Hydrogenophaga crassostreae]OAD43546.1 short-chain dehydrogenase [Hydrogenophaga crassostreae]
MSALMIHASPPGKAEAAPPPGWPLLRLGFRPFYMGAAAFALLAIPLWVAIFLGQWQPVMALPPLLWHAHEMLFGFAIAVILGFLLTAVKAWTGLATPRGATLGALALLWLAARVAAVTGPYALYAVLDLALLPLVAAVLTALLLRARNRRNLPLAAMLMLLALANGAFHLTVIGAFDFSALSPLYAALSLIVMIECVIAGRVIPAFTMSATPGLKLNVGLSVERAALALTAVALLLWAVAPASAAWNMVSGLVLSLAAVAHVLRLLQWRPLITRHRPILWILHLAYAWIPLGLALLAAAQFGWVAVSAGVHALAIGATAGLIIGMLTRTARGHTGRPLQVSRPEIAAYVLVMLAAAVRVLLPLAVPQWLPMALVIAAAAWSVAFAIYLFIYAPWLLKTRLDGKDG